MPDPDIRIPISTEADPSGIDQIIAKLDELYDKATAAPANPMAMPPEMMEPAATEETTKAIKEQAEAVATTASTYRDLAESVRETAANMEVELTGVADSDVVLDSAEIQWLEKYTAPTY